jgi:hypothetical protein
VRKNAVPKTLTTQATVPGLADVRYRAGIDRDAFMREGIESFYREQAYLASRGHQGPMPPAVYWPCRAAATTVRSARGS